MKIELWFVGKTKDPWVNEAAAHYLKRCSRYGDLQIEIIPDSRQKQPTALRKEESERIQDKLSKSGKAFTVLMDESGKQLNSVQFSEIFSKQQNQGIHVFRFIIGGAFGVDKSLHAKVDYVLSLSSMTFPHQLVRIILFEQLYRAFTILRGEGYHHV